MPDPRLMPAAFNRPPRRYLPTLPADEIEIPAPPIFQSIAESNVWLAILPVLGIVVMAGFYVVRGATESSPSSAFFAIPMVFLAVIAIGGAVMALRIRRRDAVRRRDEQKLEYLRLLHQRRVRLQAARDAQAGLLEILYPTTQSLLSRALAPDEHLWERRPDDTDFTTISLGRGATPALVRGRASHSDNADQALMERAMAMADQFSTLDNVPVTMSLRDAGAVGLSGRRSAVLGMVRAMLCQLAVNHVAQELEIILLAPPASAGDWRWLRWLPHTSTQQRGGHGDLTVWDSTLTRLLLGQLGQIIEERREHRQHSKLPHYVVLLDTPQPQDYEAIYTTLLREGQALGFSTLCLVSRPEDVPGDCETVIHLNDDDSFTYRTEDAPILHGASSESLTLLHAEQIARGLAAVQLADAAQSSRIPPRVPFLDLYNVRDVSELRTIMNQAWRRPIPRGILPHPVPIGRESLAVETMLMLDEENHGPHGVLAGTTGSGKSELLQTLVASLALEHDPRLVTLLLIDFKGGSTFNVFADLPHTVGTVTNLDGVRIRRMLEALKAEIQSRQQFFNQVNVRDITQYHRFYSRSDDLIQHPDYHPLPHLIIIVDEFAQLAREMPDFLRELVRTAQIGRSLGLHLILGTQSPMDVITDEMNANLQFRICLRVQNIEASRAMLRRPDAAYLPPNQPGRGYFQVGERGVFKLFQTGYAGEDYLTPMESDDDFDAPVVLELVFDNNESISMLPSSYSSFPSYHGEDPQPYTVARAISETIQSYSQQVGIGHMPPLLLPPLEERLPLITALQSAAVGGWNGRIWLSAGIDQNGQPVRVGSAPLAILDDVYRRTQPPLWIHLNAGEQERGGKDGHALIIGAPGTGKTMALRTLALSLALLHSPEVLHLYTLSFTGAGLQDIGRLPHAEQTIQGTETERIRRLFGRMIATLQARQADPDGIRLPIIVLFIDQYEQFRETCRETHIGDLERLVHEGRAVGIYVVMTASTINAVPDRIRSLIQQRIALQAGNTADYVLSVGRMAAMPDDHMPPGRGYVYHSPPLLCQLCLPTLQPVDAGADVLPAMNALIDQMRDGYLRLHGLTWETTTPEQRQSPSPIIELPEYLPLDKLPRRKDSQRFITPLGRADDDALSVFTWDWDANGPDVIVTGPPGSGKTNLLMAAILSAARQYSPQQVRFVLVDVNRRSLKPLSSLKHVLKRVTDVQALREQVAHLQSEMSALYAEDQKSAAHRAATILIIDDYDSLVEMLGADQEVLRQIRDLVRLYSDGGFYLWVASYLERTGDPLMKQMLLRRTGFALMRREGLQKLNVRIAGLPADAMPEGRAFVPLVNAIRVVQTALVDQPAEMVAQINISWQKSTNAAWHAPLKPHEKPASPDEPASSYGVESVEIDTAGLIQDLLGGFDSEAPDEPGQAR